VLTVAPDEPNPPDDSIARVVLRPIGSSLPLGFFAFAIGTLIFSLYQLGAIPASELHTVATLLLGAIFPLQLISGLLAYLARDTPGGTAITLLAGSWLGIGLSLLSAPVGSTSVTIGVYAISLAALLGIFAVVSMKGKVLLGVAMALAAPRYLLLGLFQIGGPMALSHASGVIGLVLVAVASYGGIALLLEDAAQRTIWPIARRGVARTSLEGGISDQLERLTNEPGVRAQL
jgi:succinate-acetate transporter protein